MKIASKTARPGEVTTTAAPRNLRVLHIYRTYFPDTQGGGEEVIRQVCHNTRPFNIESRVFALSPSPSPTPVQRPEAELHQVRQHLEISSCGISFSATRAFREQARWADVLHYHFPWPFGDWLHLSQRDVTDKPTVISYHSDIVRQKALYFFYKPLMKRFLARVDRIVATSPNYVRSSSLLTACRDKVEVIPIGLDQDQLARPKEELSARYRHQYGDDFLFFVGVFRYYKGLEFLIRAAAQTKANIVIAGSGPEESALKALARAENLSNVHFVGRIDDTEKMSYLAACRALVFPSHLPSESFGISLLEAAMQSRPMISCEIGTGTTYVNLDRETGLVVPPANPQALADAMNTLAADPDYARQLGENARRRYESLFTGARMGEQYAALYRSLHNNAATGAAGR